MSFLYIEDKLKEHKDILKHKENKIAAQEGEITSKLSEIENQKLVIYSFLFLIGVISILVFFGVKQYRKTQLANALIQKQKHQVELQKELVEEKQKEILDSINYAKRIQSAILPPLKLVKEHLENSFILYKPKDIVAGDFYWMELALPQPLPTGGGQVLPPNGGEAHYSPRQLAGESEGAILFAAADCTGHGVPGAMVSVVCNNALNRAVREFGLTDPGEILNKTRDMVISEFEKSDEDVKDGMDISLCSIKYQVESIKTNAKIESSILPDQKAGSKVKALLQWAGANNPLWIVRAPRLRSAAEPSQYTILNTQFSILHRRSKSR